MSPPEKENAAPGGTPESGSFDERHETDTTVVEPQALPDKSLKIRLARHAQEFVEHLSPAARRDGTDMVIVEGVRACVDGNQRGATEIYGQTGSLLDLAAFVMNLNHSQAAQKAEAWLGAKSTRPARDEVPADDEHAGEEAVVTSPAPEPALPVPEPPPESTSLSIGAAVEVAAAPSATGPAPAPPLSGTIIPDAKEVGPVPSRERANRPKSIEGDGVWSAQSDLDGASLVRRGGWIPVAKADVALINEQCGTVAPTIKSVWIAFLTIANDRGTHAVKTGVAVIASVAGICQRTTYMALHRLEELGFIRIQPNRIEGKKERDENTYVQIRSCNICTTGSGKDHTRSGNSCSTGPASEEPVHLQGSYKNPLRGKKEKKRGLPPAASADASLQEAAPENVPGLDAW